MDALIVFVFCTMIGTLFCIPIFPYKIVDLSRDFGEQSMHYPILHGYKKSIEMTGISRFGMWIYSNTINSTEHIGTHMDAPSHFNKNGWHMHQIPLTNLIGPGVIINVKDKVDKNPDYRVTVSDVKDWEKKYGRIPDGAMVIMYSGWGKRYPDKKKVFGTETILDISTFHHPGFHEDAISWIIENRKMYVIGTDAPSFDYGQSKTFPVHVLTAKKNICGLENIANLDAIPPSGAILSAASVKTIEGSGRPVRLYALIPEMNSNSATLNSLSIVTVIIWSLQMFC